MRFRTADLCSRWGFNDGDLLDDLLWDAGYTAVDIRTWLSPSDETGPLWHHEHAVLIVTVIAHVLPAIDQVVDVYAISTIHNPIRARTIDGVAVDEIDGDYEGVLTPGYVDVPDDVITTIAGVLYQPPAAGQVIDATARDRDVRAIEARST